MAHPWKSSGSKRTVWWYYSPSDNILLYLRDMRDATRYGVIDIPTHNIVNIQNDFSRRRRKIQKRKKKLKQTRGRQQNRVKDAMHKLSSSLIKEHPGSSFILEDLRNIRKTAKPQSKKIRTYLNRWPYNQFQIMMEYKPKNRAIYVNPEGTSSECPVCGGKVKHPVWKMSRCENCGRDYDRDRLASLAISLRGLDLCGDPLPVSAIASVPSRVGLRWHTLRTMLCTTVHDVSRTVLQAESQ